MNNFHKSVFENNDGVRKPPNVVHQDSSNTLKNRTKKISKDLGGSSDFSNSLGDIGKIKYKINSINSSTKQGVKKIEIGIGK